MIEKIEQLADEVYARKTQVLEDLAAKKGSLPVPRHLVDKELIFEAFANLQGVDVMGNAFYQAGYIRACTDILLLVEQTIILITSQSYGNPPLQGDEDNRGSMGGGSGGGDREG